MVNTKPGAGKSRRESFWREKLKQWRESGQSQAAFCKTHELSENSLSYWKMEIKKRDAMVRSAASTPDKKLKKGEEKPRQRKMEMGTSPPAFVRFAVSDCESTETVETEGAKAKASRPKESPFQQVIAAEIVDANTGRRLRIFNGADQATVATLLSALSVV